MVFTTCRARLPNYPRGVIDPVASDDPPRGCNIQDVRMQVTTSPAGSNQMLTDSALEYATLRSG